VRRYVAVSLALLVAVAAMACGVPTRDHADRADRADVPFQLVEPDSTSDPRAPRGAPVDVYFYDTGTERLVRVVLTTDDTGLDAVLRLLEGAAGSGLPVGNPLDDVEVVRAAEVARGRATVDLADSFVDLSGTDQRIALAELVYTATGRPGVGQVSFTLEGEPTEVPRGDGSVTSEPLTRSDYPDLAPSD
jgi:spore germination protein GerM